MEQKPPKPLIVGMLASLATGILTLLFLKRLAGKTDKPPKNAPQLRLHNPGSQDDFPKPPTESEIG